MTISRITTIHQLERECSTFLDSLAAKPNRQRCRLYNSVFFRPAKKAGLFDKLDYLHLYRAHDTAAALTNLIQPGTYDATANATFTANSGYAGNGSSTFVDTNFNPTTAVAPKFTRDSACFGYWTLNTGAINSNDAGNNSAGGVSIAGRRTDSGTDVAHVRMNQTSGTVSSNGTVTSTIGLTVGNRPASNVVQIYKNGLALSLASGGTIASEAIVSSNLQYGRWNTATFTTRQVSIGLAGMSLSATDHVALHTICAAWIAEAV